MRFVFFAKKGDKEGCLLIMLRYFTFFEKHEGTATFRHDVAPCHKAESVVGFFTRKEIPVPDWHGNLLLLDLIRLKLHRIIKIL